MIDPLAEVVSLLQPQARYSKLVEGAGAWRVRRSESGQPFYCVVLDGASLLTVADREPIALRQGDFVLIPSAFGFTMSSPEPPAPDAADSEPVMLADGQFLSLIHI